MSGTWLKRWWGWLAAGVLTVALALVLFADRDNGMPAAPAADQKPVVVTSFTLVADWVRAVVGEHAEVHTLTPVGAEVHEWELRPRDFVNVESADIVFYNGLGLEQWMHQVRAVVGEHVSLVALAERSDYPLQPIVTGEYAGDPDPHLWMDPRAVAAFVQVIASDMAALDPAHAEDYHHNAELYATELHNLHEELGQRLAVLAPAQRTLITSEAAFIYFAHAYDFFHDGIWGTNAEVEGSPRQIMRITDVIRERQPAAVFWESTISDRYVRSIAADANVAVAGPLYVDSVGPAGSGAEDYMDMLRYNVELIVHALGAGSDGD